MRKVWLLLIVFILLPSFIYAVPFLLDSFEGDNDDSVSVKRCIDSQVVGQAFNVTRNLGVGDTLIIDVFLSAFTQGLDADDLINVTIIAANETGEPTNEPVIIATNVTGGADWPSGSNQWADFNITFTLEENMPIGFYLMMWKCQGCVSGTSERLNIMTDTTGGYPGLPNFGMIGMNAGCDYWAADTADNFNTVTFKGFKVWGDSSIVFEPPTPPDGTRNNSQVTINVSCVIGDVSLWFDANPDPISLVIDEETSPADFTTSVSEGTFFYKASCNNGLLNSSTRSWSFDTSVPTIDLTENFFNRNNFSLLPQYFDTIDINITITDDALFGFLFNMTNISQVLLNFSTESLSGTSFNFNTTLNISALETGIYNITVTASDSHTANAIDNYDITTKDKQIIFDTAEGNRITISSDLAAVTNYKKLTDRYSFDYDFGTILTPQKVFTITSDRKITYLPDSIYTAHFVVWNNEQKQGNWIDFEGGGIPSIRKVNDYNYEITFPSLSNQITFNSIGGLNVLTENFEWYRGITNTTESGSLPVFNTTITLNITNHSSITSINAELIYDGVLFTSPNITGFPESILFEQNVTSATGNITYDWNVTVTQGDGNLSDFFVTAKHIISEFGIDNCSSFSEPAFTIFLRDEETNELIIGNGTFTFDYHPDINPTDTKQLSLQMTQRNNFSFCKSDASFNPAGDMSHTFSASTYETRGFSRVDEPFTGNFTAFLLKTSTTVQTVLFTLVDSGLARIEGATMAFHRILNDVVTNVAQEQSDFAGQVSTNLDSIITYSINITHPNFPLKEFNLKPVLSTYTIKLTTEGEILYQNAYAGLRYKIEPTGKLFNISDEFQNFTFTIEGSNLEFWGINFTRHDFECNPANCQAISTSSTGGSVTLGIKLNETGRFWTTLFFKKTGEDLVLINTWPNDGVVFSVATRSLIQLMQEIKDNTSENVRTVFAALIVVIIIAIATTLGIAGWPLAAIASLITIVLSLPNIAFINPIFGFFIASAGLVMYAFSQRV